MAVCKFEGCFKRSRLNGFCVGHNRQYRAGETLRVLQVQHHGLSEIERFWKRVGKGGLNDCWNWTASRNSRKWHGQWRNFAGDIELAHRAAWRLLKGPIPEGLFVLHRCDNPICMNPRHLFLGTQADNCKDMWKKGRARPGKSVGSKHGMSKLSEDQVLSIRASRESVGDLALRYALSRTTIYDVLKRKIWKHV